MVESDIRVLKRYAESCGFNENLTHDKQAFDIQSYSRWAVDEIIGIAQEELSKPPPCIGGEMSKDVIDIIDEFAFRMNFYYEESHAEESREIFAIARDAADDLLYFYIQERKNDE